MMNLWTNFEIVAPVPQIEMARFSDSGAGIYLTFNIPTNRAGMTTPTTCNDLFTNLPTLGSDNYCVWLNDTTLLVGLGAGATLSPGDVIDLADVSPTPVRAKDNLSGPATGFATVEAPHNPITPVIRVSVSVMKIYQYLQTVGTINAQLLHYYSYS